jgi:hypothetical protein
MRQQQAAVGGNEIEVPGGLAQLGEHLLCKQGVVGSIPSTSTIITIIRTIPKTGQVKTKRESACV